MHVTGVLASGFIDQYKVAVFPRPSSVDDAANDSEGATLGGGGGVDDEPPEDEEPDDPEEPEDDDEEDPEEALEDDELDGAVAAVCGAVPAEDGMPWS